MLALEVEAHELPGAVREALLDGPLGRVRRRDVPPFVAVWQSVEGGGASIKMAMAEPTRCAMAYACIRSETARAPPSACSTAILSAVPIEQSKQCRPFPVQVDGIQICVVVVLLGRVLADFGRGQGHLLSHR